MTCIRAALLASLVVGCGTSEVGPEDGRDDTFTTDGKLDGFTATPAEAAAILKVVNTETVARLKSEVGLSAKAADNIGYVRSGDDEAAGTADDELFDSLAELDAVPYIGPTAFQKLLDYVHDADLVGDAPVAGAWTTATVANGDRPAFALSPSGKLVIAFQVGTTYKVQLPSGAVVDAPPDARTGSFVEPAKVAVDASNTVHLFYPASTTPPASRHASYRSGQWVQHDTIAGAKLDVANGPGGQMFALARFPAPCTSCVDPPMALVTLAASGAATTETLWSAGPDDALAFTVGNDGLPVLAQGTDYSSYGRVRYARRGPSGWQQSNVSSASYGRPALATGGGSGAVVFVDADAFRQQGATFAELADDGLNYVTWIDAAVDGVGTTHACVTTTATAGMQHLRILTTGESSYEALGNGEGCWIATDATGKIHLAFSLGSVINHATYE